MYLVPKPQKMTLEDGRFYLFYDGKIVLESSCGAERFEDAVMLQKETERSLGFKLAVTAGDSAKAVIRLSVEEELEADAYRLHISEQGVELAGGKGAGLFYGIQTLRQILRQEGAALPFLTIEDWPDIPNRGVYADVTRGRIPTMEYLKQSVDRMAFYKLNQLQLYIEHTFLFEGLSEVWRDDTPLTAQDILELDAYCRKMHIELVPSLSCFGHLYKVLRTKTFEKLCELDNPGDEPFSLKQRMGHHTLNVTDEESFRFVTELIDQYLPLFTSKKFNIGADETFDLGKGKSSAKAEEVGTQRLYIDFVKRLCNYLAERGRQPMFWGDIICAFPEAIHELPENTICLNWGYGEEQSDESIQKLAKVHARQYACPGMWGWNQFVNGMQFSYANISRMCRYAWEYKAEGVLNTDWGDCGHINHPLFSVPGIIYGAAFSWNHETVEKEEINRQISVLEYGDATGEFVSLLFEIDTLKPFDWWNTVSYIEGYTAAPGKEWVADAPEHVKRLADIQKRLCRQAAHLNDWGKSLLKPYLVGVEGMKLVQRLGFLLAETADEKTAVSPETAERCRGLAAEFEEWFYYFKENWRTVSRESELYRVGEVIFKYADLLRDKANGKK